MKYISVFMIVLAHVVAAQDFYGLDTNFTTVSYNRDAIECIHNKSIVIPFYSYIYETVMNCYGDLCNVTEYFVPIY